MAGKGVRIQDMLNDIKVELNTPPFLTRDQFADAQVKEAEEIASLQIHIERRTQRIKNFHIFDKPMPLSLGRCYKWDVGGAWSWATFNPPCCSHLMMMDAMCEKPCHWFIPKHTVCWQLNALCTGLHGSTLIFAHCICGELKGPWPVQLPRAFTLSSPCRESTAIQSAFPVLVLQLHLSTVKTCYIENMRHKGLPITLMTNYSMKTISWIQ